MDEGAEQSSLIIIHAILVYNLAVHVESSCWGNNLYLTKI